MKTITAKDYFKTSKDYRDVYQDYDGTTPQWKGRRTILMSCIPGEPHGGLGIEGVHFEIKGTYEPSAYELAHQARSC